MSELEVDSLPSSPPTRNRWVLGCGSGCAVMVILGLILAFIGYQLTIRSAEMEREELRRTVQQEYAALKAEGKVPAEHEAFYDKVVAESQGPVVGLFGLLLYIGGIIEPVKDGTLTDEELELAQKTHAFLQQNAAPGPVEFANFIGDNPRLQYAIEELVTRTREGVAPPEEIAETP